MSDANRRTRFVDGVPVATATSIEDAPAIRLTDDWDAAYHEDQQLIEVVVRSTEPDGRHLFMDLNAVVRAVPAEQLRDAIRKVKTARPPTGDDNAVDALRTTRDHLAKYRRILNSREMRHVFQMAQIHGAPYSGETIDENDVGISIAHADRILADRAKPDREARDDAPGSSGNASGAVADTPPSPGSAPR